MKVSLYTRDRSTRRYAKHNPKKTYPQDGSIIWVLRYGRTFETLDVKMLAEATSLRLRRQISLDGGWHPTTKIKEPVALMLDKAMDGYLAKIQNARKPKTHQAYSTALKYFYDCIGNKPMKDIDRGDLLKFAGYLRDEKGQAPRSAYNKFESVMGFLKRHDVTGKSLKVLRRSFW